MMIGMMNMTMHEEVFIVMRYHRLHDQASIPYGTHLAWWIENPTLSKVRNRIHDMKQKLRYQAYAVDLKFVCLLKGKDIEPWARANNYYILVEYWPQWEGTKSIVQHL